MNSLHDFGDIHMKKSIQFMQQFLCLVIIFDIWLVKTRSVIVNKIGQQNKYNQS